MAISPLSDIVSDVLQAADPQTAEAARARLAAGAPAAGGQTFTVSDAPAAAGARKIEAPAQKPFQRFEAMVLQTFIENMLPKNADSAYGGGVAGDMWKGLLAEKLAGEMSERGGIGIADRLLGDHYKEDGVAVPLGAAAPAQSQGEAGRSMLPSAMLQEMQRKVFATAPAGDLASTWAGDKS